jgi:hypothetical protein
MTSVAGKNRGAVRPSMVGDYGGARFIYGASSFSGEGSESEGENADGVGGAQRWGGRRRINRGGDGRECVEVRVLIYRGQWGNSGNITRYRRLGEAGDRRWAVVKRWGCHLDHR